MKPARMHDHGGVATSVSPLARALGGAALAAIPLAWMATSAAQPQPDAPIRPAKFDHALHGQADKVARVVVDSEKCTDCHASDDTGKLTLPGTSGRQREMDVPMCNPQRGKLTQAGQVGHQPCLDAGCHVRDFLATGATTRRDAPERYARAVAFCAGCHAGDSPPASDSQPTVGNIYCDNDSPDYHIELNHLRHAQKTACRNCHLVDKDNALQLNRPNHGECATCHNGKDTGPMSYCRTCHLAPGPAAYFKAREGGDNVVRSCGSPEHLRRAAQRGKDPGQISCFKHETSAHRFKSDKPLQCSQCHYMVADRKYWSSKYSYESLRDIKSAKLIDNRRDRAHRQACGGDRACHARDVDDSSGGSEKCTLCHAM